jgi:hypothetical protein
MLDIILTVFAWRRGWKAWALLPIGITFLAGLLIGFSEETIGVILAIGLAEIGTLIYMIARPRKKKQQLALANDFSSPAASVALVAAEPPSPPAKVEPATVLVPVTKAKLVLPDNSEISLTEETRPMGRSDFEEAVSAEALSYISRQHFRISCDDGKYSIEDRGSANGTKTNGVQVKGKGRQELRDGDRIDVADVAALTFKMCEVS